LKTIDNDTQDRAGRLQQRYTFSAVSDAALSFFRSANFVSSRNGSKRCRVGSGDNIDHVISCSNKLSLISGYSTVHGCFYDKTVLRYAKHPIRMPLNAREYALLDDLWTMGLISDNCFKTWHDKCFAGFYPDNLYLKLASKKSFWDVLRVTDSVYMKSPLQPCWYLDSDHIYPVQPGGVERSVTLVDQQDIIKPVFGKEHPLFDILRSALQGKISYKFLYDTVKTYHFQTSLQLMLRQRVGLDVALKIFMMLPKHIPRNAFRDVALFMSHTLCISTECFINWAIYLACEPLAYGVVQWMVSMGWAHLPMLKFVKQCKQLHDMIRRSRVVPPNMRVHPPIDSLLYLQMTVGRYDAIDDPDLDSLGLRSQKKEQLPKSAFWHSDHQRLMYDKIFGFIDSEMSKFGSAIPMGAELLQKIRQEYYHMGASGSVPGDIIHKYLSHINLKDYAREKLNKTIAMNELSRKQMLSLLNNTDPLQTTLVWKFEPGKMRMLLPGSFDHWLQENLIMGFGESTYFARDSTYAIQLSGLEEASQILARFGHVLSNKIVSDMDYADFNIAHLPETMAHVYESLASALPPDLWVAKPELSMVELCRILACRLAKMYVNLGTVQPTVTQKHEYPALRRKVVHALYGLYSGWRSTMFLNSLMNKVYFEAAAELCIKDGGYSVVNRIGDDGHAIVPTVYAALRQLCALNDANFEMNASKQIVGKGKAEFLRVSYSAEGIRGSVVRAICSGISNDMQSPPVVRGVDALRGVYDFSANVLRRCSEHSLSLNWWSHIVGKWRIIPVRDCVLSNEVMNVAVPHKAIHSPTACGGLGLFLPGDPWYEPKNIISMPKYSLGVKDLRVRFARCAREAGSYLSRELVGISGQVLADILDEATSAGFSSLRLIHARKRLYEYDMYKWVNKWKNAKPKLAPHITEVNTASDDEQSALLRVAAALDVAMTSGVVPGYARNIIKLCDDLLAASVKGVVNIMPKLVRGVSMIPSVTKRVEALIGMVRWDKQKHLRRLVVNIGAQRFWDILTGSLNDSSDFMWNVTPQLSSFRAVIATEFANIRNINVADVFYPQYKSDFMRLCSIMFTILRSSKLNLRY
jgi:hypothetical protein